MKKILGMFVGLCFLSSCQTTGQSSLERHEEKRKELSEKRITPQSSVEELLDHAQFEGGEKTDIVSEQLSRRKLWDSAHPQIIERLKALATTDNDLETANIARLFIYSPRPFDIDLFKYLERQDRPRVKELAWRIAVKKPSEQLASYFEVLLSRALIEGAENYFLEPYIAQALMSNKLASSYSLMREGLFQKGDLEFAQAMAFFDSKKASVDFVKYLALVPGEELRQLTLSSINLYSAVFSLRHLLRYPVAVSDPNIEVLFYYAISRNQSLAEIANAILQRYLPKNKELLAAALSKLPAWAQLSFVEESRKNKTASLNLFMEELKKMTAQRDVADEIDEYYK